MKTALTAEEIQRREAAGQRLQERLGLGPGTGPSKLQITNPAHEEASRLGRLLLDGFDAQDAARRNPEGTQDDD